MSEITAPCRKRRRPALSCVECRRRKIKCDRLVPCSHCTQLKIKICTYPVTHANIVSRLKVPKASTILHPVNNHQASPEVPESSSLDSRIQLSEADPSSRSLSSLAEGSHSERGPLGSAPTCTTNNSPSKKIVQNLVNPPRNLEQEQLSSTSHNEDTDEVLSILGVNISSFGDVMLQVGGNHNAVKPKILKQGNSNAIQDLECNSHKTRFFGRSHHMNTMNMFSLRCRFKDEDGKLMTGIESMEVHEILEKCRGMAKAAKLRHPIDWHLSPNFKDYVPQREVADKLVDLYLRTCESTYRILHIPSFKQEYSEYWNNSTSTKTTLIVRMLLVMAIGTCFYQGDAEDELRSKAQQWVHSAESWTALGKSRVDIASIQIYALLLLARQTIAVDVEFIWIPSGNLLRMAFSMGLHLDPKHFPKLSFFVAEMRRRIWATVIEMTVQTSMDFGMPPLIRPCDFDTESPSNIDDEDISESTMVMPSPKPNNVFTQTSIQITLLKSLRTRLEIVQFINGFQSEPSYDAVIHFGQDITKACNESLRLIQSYPTHLPRPTAFQSNLLDIMVRRFLLEVHRPFFVKSQTDPRYYFSRKVCLETALLIFFHSGAKDLPPDHDPQTVDDYQRLKLVGGGLVKTIFFHAITIIVIELILQLEEDSEWGLMPSVKTMSSREPLYQAIDDMAKLLTDRIRMGENNVIGPVFFNAAAALIHAKTNGTLPEQVVPEAAIRSAQQCLEILRSRTKAAPHESGVQGQLESHGIGGSWSGSVGELDFELDLLMPDTNMDFGMQEGNLGFGIPDSWLFTDWDAN